MPQLISIDPYVGVQLPVLIVEFQGVRLARLDEGINTFRYDIRHSIDDNQPLHNHLPNGKRDYSYPSVQYRVSPQGCGVLAGFGEIGTRAIEQVLQSERLPLPYLLSRERLEERSYWLQYTKKPYVYRIPLCCPLNNDNHREWHKTQSLRQRLRLLEGALLGNLLGLCEKMGLPTHLSIDVEVLEFEVLGLREFPKTDPAESVPLLAFHLLFSCNLLLPRHIALGRGKSKGFGILQPIK